MKWLFQVFQAFIMDNLDPRLLATLVIYKLSNIGQQTRICHFNCWEYRLLSNFSSYLFIFIQLEPNKYLIFGNNATTDIGE